MAGYTVLPEYGVQGIQMGAQLSGQEYDARNKRQEYMFGAYMKMQEDLNAIDVKQAELRSKLTGNTSQDVGILEGISQLDALKKPKEMQIARLEHGLGGRKEIGADNRPHFIPGSAAGGNKSNRRLYNMVWGDGQDTGASGEERGNEGIVNNNNNQNVTPPPGQGAGNNMSAQQMQSALNIMRNPSYNFPNQSQQQQTPPPQQQDGVMLSQQPAISYDEAIRRAKELQERMNNTNTPNIGG